MKSLPTLLMVAGNTLFRDVMREIVTSHKIMQWAHGCATMGEAITCVRTDHAPDIVLLDLALPDGSGWWFIPHVPSSIRIVLMSNRLDEHSLEWAAKPPVAGFIDNTCMDRAAWHGALREVAAGRSFYSKSFREKRESFRSDSRAWIHFLTDRERSLLGLFAAGLSDQEIAACSDLVSHTVHNHRKSIMRKLELHSTMQLMKWAEARGIPAAYPRGMAIMIEEQPMDEMLPSVS